MHNLGDDRELDQMSREAAGKYTVPGAPDWQKMEMELDKVLPVENKRKRMLFWWLLPVLLAGGATYWLLEKNNDTVQHQSDPKTSAIAGKAPAPPPSEASQVPPENIPVVPDETAGATPAHKTVEDRARGKNAIAVSGIYTPPVVTEKSTQENTSAQQKEFTAVVTDQPNTVPNSVKQEQQASSRTLNEQVEKNTVSNPPPAAILTAKATPENTVVTEQPPVAEKNGTAPVEESPIVVDKKKLSSYRYGKGLSFAVVGGIDKSTVKFSYGDQPGMNIGAIGGYHFNDRLSIHTGAIYTQKNYTMAGQDFNAPKGSWASYYKLDEVEGYCRMWEVPVMARYAFPQNGRNNYFASVGLSSYFMTSEHYTYYYHHLGQPASRNATYGAGDSHVLSIMHLSAGFEHTLSRNLRLQVEPYAKLPLAGVGFGSIQLSSFGINFGLQFRQPSKK
jgi:hypothetical protein